MPAMAHSTCLNINEDNSGFRRQFDHDLQLCLSGHPACAIFNCYKSDQSISDLIPQLAVFLYEDELIKPMVLPATGKANLLLKGVQEAVCDDHRNLKKFAALLLKFAATRDVGDAIMTNYCIEFPDDDCLDESAMVVTEKKNDGSFEVLVQVKTKSIVEIRCQLTETLHSACKAIGDTSYKDLKLYLRRGYPYLAPQIDHYQTSDDLLAILNNECSITDVSLLEAIAEKFNIVDAKLAINDYKRKVHMCCINMDQYFTKLLSSRICPEMLTILVECDGDDCTLEADVRSLVIYSASQHCLHFKVVFVQGNCEFY